MCISAKASLVLAASRSAFLSGSVRIIFVLSNFCIHVKIMTSSIDYGKCEDPQNVYNMQRYTNKVRVLHYIILFIYLFIIFFSRKNFFYLDSIFLITFTKI